MAKECRNIMRVNFNLADYALERQHPKNERACVCQHALESEIEAGTLPDRKDATEQDRQKAVDQACRESFHKEPSYPYKDSPEEYIERARSRYGRDLEQVVDIRQRTEESNRQLAEDLHAAFDAVANFFRGGQTYLAAKSEPVVSAWHSLSALWD